MTDSYPVPPVTRRVFWLTGLAGLLFLACDGIPDTEQIDGLSGVSGSVTANLCSVGSSTRCAPAASIPGLSAYLALFFRSPPSASSPLRPECAGEAPLQKSPSRLQVAKRLAIQRFDRQLQFTPDH